VVGVVVGADVDGIVVGDPVGSTVGDQHRPVVVGE
jgi:hypothetical protein